MTEALTRLRGCAGWSAPLLFVNPDSRRQVFLRRFTIQMTSFTGEANTMSADQTAPVVWNIGYKVSVQSTPADDQAGDACDRRETELKE